MRAAARIVSVFGAGVYLIGCSSSDPTPGLGAGGAAVGGSRTAASDAGGAKQTNGQSSFGGKSAVVSSSDRGGTTVGTRASGGSSADGSDAEGGSTAAGGTGSKGGTSAMSAASSKGGTNSSSGTGAGGHATTAPGTSSTGGVSGVGGVTGGGSAATGTSTSGGATTDAKPSTGCGKTPTLKSGTITLGSRNYILKLPTNYDSSHPYRLILGLHGYGGSSTNIQSEKYFGLEPLSNGSTIFIAPNAVSGAWSASTDVTFVDEILEQVEADLCIDTSRIMLEGFSQGAAMSWSIACTSKNVFRAVLGHSGGGVANPTSCKPVAYLGSLGLGESGNSQKTQTDQFAKWNGCTIETLPTASTGSHVCTNYKGCPALDPVRWCSYDGGHTSAPTDAGQRSSWMPKEVWAFVSQF